MTAEEAIRSLNKTWEGIDEARDVIFADRVAFNMAVEALEEVEKHRETFEWCHDCKEYDQKAHCCYRWSKIIRETAEELYQQGRQDAVDEFIETLTEIDENVNMDIYTNEVREIAEQVKEKK